MCFVSSFFFRFTSYQAPFGAQRPSIYTKRGEAPSCDRRVGLMLVNIPKGNLAIYKKFRHREGVVNENSITHVRL